MNKKTIGIVGVVLLVILLIIGSTINPDKEKKNKGLSNDPEIIMQNAQEESEEYRNSKEQKEFTSIDINAYIEYLNGEDKKIVLVARPTCHYCQLAEPIIKKAAYDYDIEINYLNTDNFSEEDGQTFMNSNENFSEGFGTPMLLVVSNNEIKDVVDGLTDYAHYVKFFKENKFVK